MSARVMGGTQTMDAPTMMQNAPAKTSARAETRTLGIVLVGGGRMGRALAELVNAAPDLELTAQVDAANAGLLSALEAADAAVDFSAPEALKGVCCYARRTGTPLVVGTTGLAPWQCEALRALGHEVPVLHSANFSPGIAALRRLLPLAKAALPGYDIELIETHHRHKADAPSGTALRLLEALDPAADYRPTAGHTGPRGENEIGVHAVRGGTVAGEHSVSFFGPMESLTLTHRAESRAVFAEGALRAARRLTSRAPGFYTLEDILFDFDEAED